MTNQQLYTTYLTPILNQLLPQGWTHEHANPTYTPHKYNPDDIITIHHPPTQGHNPPHYGNTSIINIDLTTPQNTKNYLTKIINYMKKEIYEAPHTENIFKTQTGSPGPKN